MKRAAGSGSGSAGEVARLRVRDPSDFIALVPYLLGFHPGDSLVVVFLDQGRVTMTARLDLPAASEAAALARELTRLAAKVRTGDALLLGYGDPEPTRNLLEALLDRLRLDLLDVLVVGPDRWWSLCCPGTCCPADGSPYDLSSHPLAAEAVLAGLSATSSRDRLYDLTAGPPAAEASRLTALAAEAARDSDALTPARRRKRMVDLIRQHLGGELPDDEACARFAVLATDLSARDAAFARMTRERANEYLDLWRRVVSRTAAPLAAAPLCLLGIAAWLAGNGALLNCCIERMEDVDPDYPMLQICRDISERALSPTSWETIAEGTRRRLGTG